MTKKRCKDTRDDGGAQMGTHSYKPRKPKIPEAGSSGDLPHRSWEVAQPHRHFDLGLPVFRNVDQYITMGLCGPICLPEKLIQKLTYSSAARMIAQHA